MGNLLLSLRHAVRALARTPAFTATVVLTLALGIGANSAVFSAIDAVLLRPLPFPDADRLVHISETRGSEATSIAPVRLQDWNDRSSTFRAITGYFSEDVSDTTGDLPERVRGAWVAPRFIEVWGVAPALGRDFTHAEQRAAERSAVSAVLISDRYWRNRFGADPNVLGRTVRLGESAPSIVGVMPASFRFPERDVDLWFPDAIDRPAAQSRRNTWYQGIGRLEPGVTLEQAHANLSLVQAQLAEQYPDTDRDIGVSIVPLKEVVVGDVGRSLWLVYGAVSVLLLIACANIAALLLSRAARREGEIAIRFSLGASRSAVAVQLLTESAVLAVAGAAAGLLVAAGSSAAFRIFAPDLPRLDEIMIDERILLYTVVSAVGVALLCGLVPAVRGARSTSALTHSGRTQVSPRHSLQWLLVGVQVALSITLLAGAGLLLRSFEELSRVDRGFDAGRVLAFRVSGDWGETADYDRLVQRVNDTVDELNGLPGVDTVATSVMPPGVPGGWGQEEFAPAEGRADDEARMIAENRFVSPAYFEALRIPLVAGDLCRRPPDAAYRRGAATLDAMVNRSFVDAYVPGASVIGLELVETTFGSSRRIVGVVGDARENGIHRNPVPTVYSCFSAPNPTPWFLVRTRGDPMAVAGAVRLKLQEVEPLRSVYDITPLEEQVDDAYAENRLRTYLLAAFAATALALACLGIYGTLSYVVSLRRREVGLRVALGALSSNIATQFLVKALRVVALAGGVGLALSFVFARALEGMLYGVSPTDPVTLSAVVVIVAVVAAVAALFPAMRAARIDPMQALREE